MLRDISLGASRIRKRADSRGTDGSAQSGLGQCTAEILGTECLDHCHLSKGMAFLDPRASAEYRRTCSLILLLPTAPRPSLPSIKPQHAHSHSFSSLPTTSTSAAPPPDPPPRTDMYLARAPPPQKHSSGWLSYMFGTTPGHTAGDTPKEEERPMDPVERRTSNVSAEPVLPGTFPVAPRNDPVDAGKREELVRGGGRLGGSIAEPVKPKAPVMTTPALVLPSTYVKPDRKSVV